MKKLMTFHKKKSWTVFLCCVLIMAGLIGRLAYLMCFCSERYYDRAEELHERERDIKAARGLILDARGKYWLLTGQSVQFLLFTARSGIQRRSSGFWQKSWE